VNAKENVFGETALFFAASHNRADVIKLLISKGADMKVRTAVTKLERPNLGPDGEKLDEKTAEGEKSAKQDERAKDSEASIEKQEPESRETGKEADSADRAKDRSTDPPVKKEQNPKAGVKQYDGKDAYGFTAEDRKKRVFGTTQTGGLSALLIAARGGHADAVRALLDARDDINQTSDTDHATPLVLALINGHYDLAKLLLDRGANPKLATTDGVSPLYALIDVQWPPHTWYPQPVTSQEHTQYLDLISELMVHGADPNAAISKRLWFRVFANDETWFDIEGATPFLRAAVAGDLAAMKLLVEHGANLNLTTKGNDSPLMVAAGVGWAAYWTSNAPYSRLDAVKFCLDHGADLNAKDAKGYNALDGAAFRGDNEMVKYLVSHGADVHSKTKAGDTVADLANGMFEHAIPHPDTVALLESMGSENSHNCRSNECVVPPKEDKPKPKQTADEKSPNGAQQPTSQITAAGAEGKTK
jgi:ankyrin repeat protein